MKPYIKLQELVGQKVIFTEKVSDELVLITTESGVLTLEASCGRDGEDLGININEAEECDFKYMDGDEGLIYRSRACTDEEYKVWEEEQKVKALGKEARETEKRRKQYEKLKAEFEK